MFMAHMVRCDGMCSITTVGQAEQVWDGLGWIRSCRERVSSSASPHHRTTPHDTSHT